MAFLCALLLSLTCQGQDLELLIEGAKLNDSLVRSGMGHRVRELVRGRQPAGWHSVVWDGRDELGRQVASGVYLCRFQAGKFSDVVKLLLSR